MQIWTLPNLMTVARLGSLPLILLLLWPGVVSPATTLLAMFLYVLAGVFDVVDGHVARRTGQVTVVGKFLDPLADKLIYLVTLTALLQLPGSWVPTWVVLVALTRELAITGLRTLAVSEGVVIAAGRGGKLKTSFGTAGMCGLMLHYPFVLTLGGEWQTVVHPQVVGLWVTYVSLFFSLTSAFVYMRNFYRALIAGEGAGRLADSMATGGGGVS